MEEQKSNKFLLGIIGALIGAFVGAIPWVLIYVFANYIVAIVAALIAICSYWGYKITKAKIDKKLPIIISITSIIAITVSTFLISPLIELAKEGYTASLENIQILYQYDQFTEAIIRDYVVSIIFTALGISGVVSNLHKQIKNGVSREDIKINLSNQVQPVTEGEMNDLKEVFSKNDALRKENGLTREEIIQDLTTQMEENRANEIFNLVKMQNIIRKSHGRFYFSEKAQKSNFYRTKKSIIIAIVTMLVVVAVIIGLAIASDSSSSNNTAKNKTSNKSNYTIDQDRFNEISNNIADINKSINNVINSTNTIQNSTGVVLPSTNIKFVPKDGMEILTKEEIEEYWGENFEDYDIVAMNEDGSRMLYAFVFDGTELELDDYTAEEFLMDSLSVEEDEVKTINISGFSFAKVITSFEENGTKYTEECYVCKLDSRFVCFDYSYKQGEKANFSQMIQKK